LHGAMQDARWSQLKQSLLERGWTARDNAMYAPHETLWFATTTANPDLALFRDRMSDAAEAMSAHSIEQAERRQDLMSLVSALDDLLEN
jgi:hypothetical protein